MSIWRNLTEIGYELALNTPLFFQNRLAFYIVTQEQDVHNLRQICSFFNPVFPVKNIVSADYYKQNKISEKKFQGLCLSLEIDQNISQKDLIDKLTDLEFERSKTANLEKTFAVRGDVVDIYYIEPIRIEFDNEKISKIYSFNLNSNKQIKKLSELVIYPDKIPANAKIIREENLKLEFISPKFYNLRFKELQSDVKKYLKIIVYTQEPEKIKKILPEAKIISSESEKPVSRFQLESFILPAEHIIFLTDENIFGSPMRQEKTEVDEDFIKNLKAGDYVVHIDHGIAKYGGTKEMDKQRYFYLQYAQKDKLFVPYNSADRLEKYIGAAAPKLHRLDDASWDQLINKIKKKAEVIAKELLDIYARREITQAPKFDKQKIETELAASFKYELTSDQQQTLEEIYKDSAKSKPMDRLICGDVGFGKTEVAIRAAFRAVLNGWQVAVLCPTTILVQQHFDTFMKRLDEFGINVELLSRFKSDKQQKQIVENIKQGKTDIIIGTHRLLSEDIKFDKLGLLIIDEEQKFGVKHKEKLKKIKHDNASHVLTLTATPIPRTLNLSLSGLRDISIIRTPPPNRLKIKTIIEKESEQIIKQAIDSELKRQGQVYFLHNNVANISFTLKKLQKLFPQNKIAIAHGQMEPPKLARVMHEFDQGQIDILICSTIIENGLDIPNANTLIVEDAPNFGLSQLHQIRGRIGRSFRPAYAYLLYKDRELSDEARKRLKALIEYSDLGQGFELAMKDLELRGVGNILGKTQSGQAEAIGLNLYLRLLNTAIKNLQK